jgi:hypothetical protein
MTAVAAAIATRAEAGPSSGDGVVRFQYTNPDAESVYLVGDFNGWSPTATPLDLDANGVWEALVFIDPGTYEYKLFVDGEWMLDPDNPEVSESGNSVVRVGPAGSVSPPAVAAGSSEATASTSAQKLGWYVRYLGFVPARRQREEGRWELERPLHDVDVRLDVDFTHDASAWFLTNFNNKEEGTELSRTSLRFDRGEVMWRPPGFDLRLFENHAVTDWDDAGTLVGKVGIYDDPFGYLRRGAWAQKRFLGAPIEFFYTDHAEPALDSLRLAPVPELPPTPGSFGGYESANTDRNADALALRARAGKADRGLEVAYRNDRGGFPGRLLELQLTAVDTAMGRAFDTRENWDAWSVELRLRPFGTRLQAQYLSGSREARATSVQSVGVSGSSGAPLLDLGEAQASDARFALDDSRRVAVRLTASEKGSWDPTLRYEYHEHNYSALVTGTPFLMRRNRLAFDIHGGVAGTDTRFELEQNWFEYPSAATWETQFWFRKHVFWLDQSKARSDRYTLLGADRASRFFVEASRALWDPRDLRGSLRFTYSAPGFDRAPRYMETVLRFAIDVWRGLELRTHSRLASYRRYDTQDPRVLALVGPGPHIEAGVLANAEYADAAHDYKNYWAHFVELVYPFTERSDIALGFGVDPWVVYEIRNAYMDIGWDRFLFENGASPLDAFADPVNLGTRIRDAESALEAERRLVLEVRLRF